MRRSGHIRSLVRETDIGVSDLIAPIFVREGLDSPLPVVSMPGVTVQSLRSLEDEAKACLDSGLRTVILFGIPADKDALGSAAYAENNIAVAAVRLLKDKFQDDLVVMADLCLDEYSDHGHCGVLGEDGTVQNDETLLLYSKTALLYAKAGVDFVAPSGMMDGQVGAIRSSLESAGYHDTAILAYSAKYATALYGPFRDAVDVTIADGGDRKTYQQDIGNVNESLREIALDIEEGADMVMVKPAVTNLDVIAKAKAKFGFPLAAYQVSGEYSMIAAAAAAGVFDGTSVAYETLMSIKRAGADAIITYFAKEIAKHL